MKTAEMIIFERINFCDKKSVTIIFNAIIIVTIIIFVKKLVLSTQFYALKLFRLNRVILQNINKIECQDHFQLALKTHFEENFQSMVKYARPSAPYLSHSVNVINKYFHTFFRWAIKKLIYFFINTIKKLFILISVEKFLFLFYFINLNKFSRDSFTSFLRIFGIFSRITAPMVCKFSTHGDKVSALPAILRERVIFTKPV